MSNESVKKRLADPITSGDFVKRSKSDQVFNNTSKSLHSGTPPNGDLKPNKASFSYSASPTSLPTNNSNCDKFVYDLSSFSSQPKTSLHLQTTSDPRTRSVSDNAKTSQIFQCSSIKDSQTTTLSPSRNSTPSSPASDVASLNNSASAGFASADFLSLCREYRNVLLSVFKAQNKFNACKERLKLASDALGAGRHLSSKFKLHREAQQRQVELAQAQLTEAQQDLDDEIKKVEDIEQLIATLGFSIINATAAESAKAKVNTSPSPKQILMNKVLTRLDDFSIDVRSLTTLSSNLEKNQTEFADAIRTINTQIEAFNKDLVNIKSADLSSKVESLQTLWEKSVRDLGALESKSHAWLKQHTENFIAVENRINQLQTRMLESQNGTHAGQAPFHEIFMGLESKLDLIKRQIDSDIVNLSSEVENLVKQGVERYDTALIRLSELDNQIKTEREVHHQLQVEVKAQCDRTTANCETLLTYDASIQAANVHLNKITKAHNNLQNVVNVILTRVRSLEKTGTETTQTTGLSPVSGATSDRMDKLELMIHRKADESRQEIRCSVSDLTDKINEQREALGEVQQKNNELMQKLGAILTSSQLAQLPSSNNSPHAPAPTVINHGTSDVSGNNSLVVASMYRQPSAGSANAVAGNSPTLNSAMLPQAAHMGAMVQLNTSQASQILPQYSQMQHIRQAHLQQQFQAQKVQQQQQLMQNQIQHGHMALQSHIQQSQSAQGSTSSSGSGSSNAQSSQLSPTGTTVGGYPLPMGRFVLQSDITGLIDEVKGVATMANDLSSLKTLVMQHEDKFSKLTTNDLFGKIYNAVLAEVQKIPSNIFSDVEFLKKALEGICARSREIEKSEIVTEVKVVESENNVSIGAEVLEELKALRERVQVLENKEIRRMSIVERIDLSEEGKAETVEVDDYKLPEIISVQKRLSTAEEDIRGMKAALAQLSSVQTHLVEQFDALKGKYGRGDEDQHVSLNVMVEGEAKEVQNLVTTLEQKLLSVQSEIKTLGSACEGSNRVVKQQAEEVGQLREEIANVKSEMGKRIEQMDDDVTVEIDSVHEHVARSNSIIHAVIDHYANELGVPLLPWDVLGGYVNEEIKNDERKELLGGEEVGKVEEKV